ncbi:hypothetical protein HMPREF3038_02741 [Akkermansia sp. KLE1797]|nr:hypothetical protein HMPREF3038_02741 [Akkermansia sp. KLE1797]
MILRRNQQGQGESRPPSPMHPHKNAGVSRSASFPCPQMPDIQEENRRKS